MGLHVHGHLDRGPCLSAVHPYLCTVYAGARAGEALLYMTGDRWSSVAPEGFRGVLSCVSAFMFHFFRQPVHNTHDVMFLNSGCSCCRCGFFFFFFFFFFFLFYSLLFALILLCFISVVRFAILASPSGLRWLRYLVNPTFHVEDWDSACHAGAIGMTVAR